MDGPYMVRRRMRATARTGEQVNIAYGTFLNCSHGIIYYKDKPLCNDDCQLQKDYLVEATHPGVRDRAKMINDILKLLTYASPDDTKTQRRWDKLWKDEYANQFRRQDFEDYWLWSNKFYDAGFADLSYIYNIITKV